MMCSNVFAKLPRTRPQVERRAPMMHTTLVPHLEKASLSISLPSSGWWPYLDTSLDANGPVKAYVATIALPTPDTFQQRPSVLQTFIYKYRWIVAEKIDLAVSSAHLNLKWVEENSKCVRCSCEQTKTEIWTRRCRSMSQMFDIEKSSPSRTETQ